MIDGRFVSGAPRLRARVWLITRDHRASVDFLLDPASPTTVVSTGDLGRFFLPLDDLSGVAGVAGVFGVLLGLSAAALLMLDTAERGIALETVDVVVAHGLEGTSRLGRDVLNRWLMVYDPGGNNLLFEPYSDSDEDADASPR